MARVLKNHTLYSSEYFGHDFCKKTLSLPKNMDIVSVHENIRDGMPCPGLAITTLENAGSKDMEKYEFIIFPLGASQPDGISLSNYTYLGSAQNTSSSYYKVYYKKLL